MLEERVVMVFGYSWRTDEVWVRILVINMAIASATVLMICSP
jgi:hypothetical protein